MRAISVQLGCFLLGVFYSFAQALGPTNVQKVQVVNEGEDVRVEVTLSTSVKPSVVIATNPDRLVLELPNTSSDGKQKHVAVHSRGIRGIRIGLHQADPPVTHVVIDLDQSVPYRLLTEGNRITVIISPAELSASTHRAPARAVSGGLTGIFRTGQKSIPAASPNDSGQLSKAPPTGEPIAFPTASDSGSGTSSGGANSRTTASVPPMAPQTAEPGSSFPGASIAAAATTTKEPSEATLIPTAEAAQDGPDSAKAGAETAPYASQAVTDSKDLMGTDQTLLALQAADPSLRTVFRVKYVADGVVYLDGGSSAGLGEGMKLVIRDSDLPVQQGTVVDPNDPRVISELQITAVADTSSVADIHEPKRPVKVGDLAYLSSADIQALIQQRTLSATRKYPAVVTFTDDTTMDEEGHDEVPRPPLPSVNRARGMFGFDYMTTMSSGSTSMTNSNVGFSTRMDITRIGGTYWNVRGYWRGRLTSEAVPTQPTLQDLINRTYHLNVTYENPGSRLVAGFGRLYLPWAPSLDTIDGGYFGVRGGHGSTFGIFAGSTPDPTSWSYNPDGKIAGAFVNFEGGSYDDTHYTSTSGVGLNAMQWHITRPFVFFENQISYKRFISIYDSLQADSPSGNPAVAAPGAGLSRNFLTIRIQPHPRLEFDVNHTYFRDIPTFDPQLVGTGLLDKYLFQGFSVGARVEVVKKVWVYTDIGQSNRTGDSQSSLNQAFGLTFARIPWVDMRADVHYSRFNSSFGSGSYRALSVSRNVSEAFQLQMLLGDESFSSGFTNNTSSRFINATAETFMGAHYFLQGGFTVNRGSMNYNQMMFTMGYRFDSRSKRQ